MIKIPHVSDFYFGDESILNMSTILCVIDQIEFVR